MQQNAHLVPVLCFGELSTLRNFIDLPKTQVWKSSALYVETVNRHNHGL